MTTKELGQELYKRNPSAYSPYEAFWVIGAVHELARLDPVDAVAYAERVLACVTARFPGVQREG